jgi:3-isopropylmalate/(R)-2-methylmalate dehydratase small subunit
MTPQTHQLRQIAGTAISLNGNDVDTDRIIPARFLKHLTFDALGRHVFEDDRKHMAASGKVHPFDVPARAGATILLVAKNFGCGSSREHAPQALSRWGIGAVAGESFGEIFHGNAAAIGLPCVVLGAADAAQARALVEADPELKVTVDLEHRALCAAGRTWPLEINESLRERFVSGKWDTLRELATALEQVRDTERRLPYLNGWQTSAATARTPVVAHADGGASVTIA